MSGNTVTKAAKKTTPPTFIAALRAAADPASISKEFANPKKHQAFVIRHTKISLKQFIETTNYSIVKYVLQYPKNRDELIKLMDISV